MSRENHPVWIVYDKLRSACLNVKYYSRRLQTLERWNFTLEFPLSATAPSSAIAALFSGILSTASGKADKRI